MIILLSRTEFALLLALIVSIAIIIGVFVFFLVCHLMFKHNFKYFYYKKIYDLALNNDYYLINNFVMKFINRKVNVDHLLFAEKYIYLIADYKIFGNLIGNPLDPSLVCVGKKTGKKSYIPNYLQDTKRLIKTFVDYTKINPTLMLGVVLINDDAEICDGLNLEDVFICKRKDFINFINSKEKDNVANINQEELHKAVQAIERHKTRP